MLWQQECQGLAVPLLFGNVCWELSKLKILRLLSGLWRASVCVGEGGRGREGGHACRLNWSTVGTNGNWAGKGSSGSNSPPSSPNLYIQPGISAQSSETREGWSGKSNNTVQQLHTHGLKCYDPDCPPTPPLVDCTLLLMSVLAPDLNSVLMISKWFCSHAQWRGVMLSWKTSRQYFFMQCHSPNLIQRKYVGCVGRIDSLIC